MAYNKKNYYKRAQLIQEITTKHYEPENQSKCYKMVWKKYIYPQFGIGYRTYLTYCKVKTDREYKKEITF